MKQYLLIIVMTFSGFSFAGEDVKGLLEKELNVSVRDYSTFDFGRAKQTDAVSFLVPENQSNSALLSVRKLLPDGYQSFIGTTRNLSDDNDAGVEIVVIKSEDKMDILRTAQSDGINYGLTNEIIIERISSWDRLYGVDIFHAETDTIQLKLEKLPSDLNAFAQEVYKFCPDIIDQGSGNIEDISEYLKGYKSIYLWWD